MKQRIMYTQKESTKAAFFLRSWSASGALSSLLCFFLSVFCGRAFVFGNFNPFAVPLLASFLPYGNLFFAGLAGSIFSLATNFQPANTANTAVSIAVLLMLRTQLNKKKSTALRRAILSCISAVIPTAILVLASGFSLLGMLTATVQLVVSFGFAYILSSSIDLLEGEKRNIISQEEFLSIMLLSAGVVLGSSNLYYSYFFFAVIAASFICNIIAYKAGSMHASVAGIVTGLALLLSGYYSVNFVAIFSISAIVAGSLALYTKFAVAGAFLTVSVLLSYYLDAELLNYNMIFSLLMGAVAFLLVPKKFLMNFSIMKDKIMKNAGEEYLERLRAVTQQSLTEFSDSFLLLSKKLKDIPEQTGKFSADESSKTIDHIAAELCSNCSMKTICWKKEFYSTYQSMSLLVRKSEEKGFIEKVDLADDFASKCIDIENLIVIINRLFETSKYKVIWKKRQNENRELVSEQLSAVSEIVNNLADEIDLSLIFHKDFENEIKFELDRQSIDAEEVIVMQNKTGKFEVSISMKSCSGRDFCRAKIVPLVSKVMRRKFEKTKQSCNSRGAMCTVNLAEAAKYKVSSSVSRLVKTDSEISGDNFTVLNLREKSVFALSDGMGSGVAANNESEGTIELLEQFVESGFSEELSVKLINSVFVLKSDEDIYSTLDILSIDLQSGIGEFIKIGAAEAYLLRNSVVGTIHTPSLPVGIVKDIDLQSRKIKFRHNDMILMLTDGVKDSSSESFIEKALEKFRGKSADELAEYIIGIAKEKNPNNIFDDMTALAIKIVEK